MPESVSRIITKVFAADHPVKFGLVAGITDKYGGTRVVVTDEGIDSIYANVDESRGETVHVVPDHYEPFYSYVDGYLREDGHRRPLWNRTEALVEIAEREIERSFSYNPCGSCRACCITPYANDPEYAFVKPSHSPCKNLCASGCSVYENRPNVCRKFECLWLKSQRGNRPMPKELRPDKAGAFLTDNDEGAIRVHVEKGRDTSPQLNRWMTQRASEGDSFTRVHYYYGEK